MKGIYSDKGGYTFHIIEGGEPISRDSPILPDKDEYERIAAEGKERYLRRTPTWCACDKLTAEKAASLLSGLLPREDTEGRIFYIKYRAGPEGIVIDGIDCSDCAFGLFTLNFDCYVDVRQILTHSHIEENAHPREWARYAHSKGLLPHKNRPGIDNSPLLSLLEPDYGGVLAPHSDTDSALQPKSQALYSTLWLTIQDAAIARFFHPRRNPDAKKEEVVEWINASAVRSGQKESRQIAETIFTMIKPEDHDPKKKRGEPL